MVSYLKFFCKLLGYWVHKLSEFMPRDQSKWVFGSHFGYADNPKYLFLDTCMNHTEIHAIWISHNYRDIKRIRDLGLKAYHWLDMRGIFHALTSKVWISGRTIIDINRCVSGGACYVNLHHGVGLKKCYWQRQHRYAHIYGISEEKMNNSFLFKVQTFPYLFRVADLCLVTSHSQGEDFIKPQYKLSDYNCLCANAPRNKILTRSKNEIKSFVTKYENKDTSKFINSIERYKKIYMYMPTWRDNGEDFIESAHMDLGLLDNVLKQKGDLLIMKLHPFTKLNMSQIESCSNICIYPSDVDLFTILPFVHCLITDYSSVYSDAVYMNKEIILYTFDLKDYIKKCHDLGEYDVYYRGTRVYSYNELLQIIDERRDCHLSKSDRDFLMEYYWGYADNGIDIVSEIKNRIGWKN